MLLVFNLKVSKVKMVIPKFLAVSCSTIWWAAQSEARSPSNIYYNVVGFAGKEYLGSCAGCGCVCEICALIVLSYKEGIDQLSLYIHNQQDCCYILWRTRSPLQISQKRSNIREHNFLCISFFKNNVSIQLLLVILIIINYF